LVNRLGYAYKRVRRIILIVLIVLTGRQVHCIAPSSGAGRLDILTHGRVYFYQQVKPFLCVMMWYWQVVWLCSRAVNVVDSRGNTALHIAAQQGMLECMKILLRNGANIETGMCWCVHCVLVFILLYTVWMKGFEGEKFFCFYGFMTTAKALRWVHDSFVCHCIFPRCAIDLECFHA